MSTNYNLMGAVKEIAQRVAKEHIGVTQIPVQRVVTNNIPHLHSGSKYLINLNLLMEYLNSPQTTVPKEQIGAVHPIPEKKGVMR